MKLFTEVDYEIVKDVKDAFHESTIVKILFSVLALDIASTIVRYAYCILA